MNPKVVIIRGSPATGKSTLAKELAKKIQNKVALLILDEFKWNMTSHEPRDKKDFEISFENYLFACENYLKEKYTIICEDSWVQRFEDESTDVKAVINLAKKYDAQIIQVLLKGSFETVKHINTLRPMVLAENDLKELFDKVYSIKNDDELIIEIDGKQPSEILSEVLDNI